MRRFIGPVLATLLAACATTPELGWQARHAASEALREATRFAEDPLALAWTDVPVTATPVPSNDAALEAGAEDVESGEDEHSIWTAMDALHEVSKALEASLGAADSAKLAWRPQTLVEVDEANAATLLKMIDTLEDDDDVQTVWGNYDVSDDVMAKLG